MIFIAGITIALFIQLLLISKKEKSMADKILFLWIMLISVHLFLNFLIFSENYLNFHFLLGMEQPFPIFYGILLYFYTGSITEQLPKRKMVLLIHFVPVVATYLYLIPFFMLSADQKIFVYQNNGAGYEHFLLIKEIIFPLLGIGYVAWSLLLLRRHHVNIENQFSDIEKVKLNWLKLLIICTGFLWLLAIVFSDMFVFTGIAAFVFIISFFGIKQKNIFLTEQIEATQIDETGEKKKYAKSGLTSEVSEKLYEKLKILISESEIHKNSELTINELAKLLETLPNYLSQVINEKEGMNFYDFINNLRLEEFKKLVAIPKNQHFTLLALAYDCGFNSKTSFNRYFKKATGQTSSQYFELNTKV